MLNKIAPYLLVPTALWMFWVVTYLDHAIGGEYGDWWDFPFVMTLTIVEIIAIVVSIVSIQELSNRWKKDK